MQAVCQGDRQAYKLLVDRHCQAISHYAFRLCGNQSEAEDISQETFLRLWTQSDKWQPAKAKLSTWLHRITHNLCIDLLRKQSRIETEANTEELQQSPLWQYARYEESNSDQSDPALRLQQVLARLPEAQRSALMLCSHSGFSNQEAADIMGLSVKALESTLARARRSLRSKLFDD